MEQNFKKNYQDFIENVLHTQKVWGLQCAEGWAVCESNDYKDKEVLLFWSDENKAKKLAIDEWADYQPMMIEIDEFIDSWLHGMDEDGIYVGVDWGADLDGVEIEPVVLIDDLLDD